jgi:dipeptidyl aminopeptidase/acylaminoacyl peptidase
MRIVCTLLLLVQFVFAQNKEKVLVTDLLQVKTASNIVANSSGNKIIFSVQQIEPETTAWEYKYSSQLFMLALPNGNPIQLTYAKEGANNAQWHPNGESIFFTRSVDGKNQLFQLSLQGGEPKQITNSKYSIGNYKIIQAGNSIVFSSSIALHNLLTDTLLNPLKALPEWPFEKAGFTNNSNLQANTAKANPNGSLQEIRAYLEQNEKDKKAKVFSKLNFQDEATTNSEMNFTHWFMLELTANAKPKPLTKGFYSFSNLTPIPTTNNFLAEARINTTEHPDRNLAVSLVEINGNTGAITTLLSEKDKSFSIAAISPSGKTLAYQYGNTGFVSIPTLAVMNLMGNITTKKDIVYDRNKSNFKWSSNEQQLYFTSSTNGGTVINVADIATLKVTTLTNVTEGINSYALLNNGLVYSKHNVSSHSNIYSSNLQGKNEQLLTQLNNWQTSKQISIPERFSFINEKGMEVEYWVMKPTNYEVGKKFPLLLEIHGGPSAMWGPGEAGMWHEYQYFCSNGYGVVYSNPRGSSGYGENFLRGNINDWGVGPTNDVLTAVNKTISQGWVDTTNLFITGGSYAGYLTAWIIAHDKRFKAACAQRGVYELNTFFGEGNAWRLVPNYFGGYSWNSNSRKILDEQSPFNYVENITTPLIIFHGENDLRTGVIQSEMLYKALKVLGRTVEYVRHPGATHEITRSGNNRQRIDQMLRTFEFFERFRSK